jgi:cell division protein FtsN
MRRSMSKKRSYFRRKFLFILSLFFVLLIFLLGVEVGQRFSGSSLQGQKRGSENRYLLNKEKNEVEINEALDNSSEEDLPNPKITFYDSLKGEEKEVSTPVATPSSPEEQISPKEEVKKDRENSLPVAEDSKLKPQSFKYALQLGSYKSRSKAEELEKELRGKGYNAYILETSIPDKGTWYRVRVGDYEDLEQVKRMAANLQRKEGLSVIITEVAH